MLVRFSKKCNLMHKHSRPEYATDNPSHSFTWRYVPQKKIQKKYGSL